MTRSEGVLRQRGLFRYDVNEEAKGVSHQYEKTVVEGDGGVVVDHATGLMWQEPASPDTLDHNSAVERVARLSKERYAGFSDWRLPTLEEAMSLMESMRMNGRLHIDPIFENAPDFIWTADKESRSCAWYVSYGTGICSAINVKLEYSVRAVRHIA